MTDDRVCVQISASGVADVTMMRASKHNALDQAMFEGLINAAEQVATDKSIRAVVLHGEGKSFCSGLDNREFHGWRRRYRCPAVSRGWPAGEFRSARGL